jgi:hypothetical protein
MERIGLSIILLSLYIAAPGNTEPPPATYREAVQSQLQNKFNENDIVSFVYQVYSMYDRHAPVDQFLPLLAPRNLEMRFPEATLRSHADFKRWYAEVGKAIASNTHTLESVKATLLGGGRYQADIVGIWQAESRNGEYIVFRFRQRWTLLDGPGKKPIIQGYTVEAAD